MNDKKASDFFHKEDNYNCAQAVLKFFESHDLVTDDVIAEYKAFGGGRAPEGTCGALFAAQKLAGCPCRIEKLNNVFEQETGSTKCREIKKAGKYSCAECVNLAAENLTSE
jgi:hypothetical protein